MTFELLSREKERERERETVIIIKKNSYPKTYPPNTTHFRCEEKVDEFFANHFLSWNETRVSRYEVGALCLCLVVCVCVI